MILAASGRPDDSNWTRSCVSRAWTLEARLPYRMRSVRGTLWADMIESGNIVTHRARPQWGFGIIGDLNPDGRVVIDFAHRGEVILAWDLAGKHIELVDVGEGPPPNEVMRTALWAFAGKPQENTEDFATVLKKYHTKAGIEESEWDPDEIVLPRPAVEVMYKCTKRRQKIEPILRLFAEGAEGFHALELLWKLHNGVVGDLRKADDNTFEGIVLSQATIEDAVPRYRLIQKG